MLFRFRLPTATQALEHPGDFLILVTPALPDGLFDIADIETVADPDPHLVTRTNRHGQKSFELRARCPLLGKAFSDVRTDTLAGTPDLIGQAVLFNCWKAQARAMNFQRQPVSSSEDLEVFERSHDIMVCHAGSDF